MAWASYEYARRCTGGAKPGAVALMAWINKNYPKSKNWGIYSCRTIPGSGGMSLHGEGRALDVGYEVVNGKGNPDGYRLFSHLKAHAVDLGIQGIIWDRKISSNRGDNRPYTAGGNDLTEAHVDHLHIELTNAAANTLTAARIADVLGTPPADVITGVAGGSDTLAADVETLLSGTTWLRIAMFIGGVMLILLGLGIFQSGAISRLMNGDVMGSVKAAAKASKKTVTP